MIVKIQPANPGIKNAVRYNESKMNGQEGVRNEENTELRGIEDGYVLATRNVPEGSSLLDEFEKLEMISWKKKKSGGPRIKNLSFHMSVNPSESDRKLPDEEAVRLIDEIMSGLGYKEQPYRIYKHTDISRMHYHVVSCREGYDGKKINDSFERLKLRTLLKELTAKYGFELVLSDEEKKEIKEITEEKNVFPDISVNKKEKTKISIETKKTDKEKTEKEKIIVLPFSRDNDTPVCSQIKNCVEDALQWHFSTFEQLQYLLQRRYNVQLEIEKDENEGHIVIAGSGKNHTPITPFITEDEIGIRLLETIMVKIDKEKMHNRREQKQRLETLARAAAKASQKYEDFLKLMEQKGVWIILSVTEENQDIFGVTYLDRATKCAWKGSETSVGIKWLKEIAQEKNWVLSEDSLNKYKTRRNKIDSRTSIKTRPENKQKENSDKSREIKHRPSGKKFVAGHQQGSNASVLNNKDELDKNKRDDNTRKEYIGE